MSEILQSGAMSAHKGRGAYSRRMVIPLEQLNLEPRQREAARLCLLGKDQVEIGIALGGIKQPAVSMLLARAEANAAAQGVSLYLRRRSRSVRTRSLSRFRV